MDETTLAKYFHQIMKRQEIIIEQLSSICCMLAKDNDLPVENTESDEDEII